jgi:hypothetical protein
MKAEMPVNKQKLSPSLLWDVTQLRLVLRYRRFGITRGPHENDVSSCTALPLKLRTICCRLLLKCDDTRAETKFRLSAKRTSPFKSAGSSVQSTTGSRGVRISSSNAGYTMFRGSVKGTGYPLHSPVSPSLPLPCVTVCHHISTGLCLNIGNYQSALRHIPEDLKSCRQELVS